MAKYLVMWEMDLSRASTDLNIESRKVMKIIDIFEQDVKEGIVKDFGCFAGGAGGYWIAEGNATDVFKQVYKYSPFMICKAHAVISLDELTDAVKSWTG